MFQPLETLANGLLLTSGLPSDEHEDSHCGDNKEKFKKVSGSKENIDKREETAFGPKYTKVFKIRPIPLPHFQKSTQIVPTSSHHDIGCSGTEVFCC